MSHIVKIECRLHDPVAVAAACQRLNLPAPVHGTAELFSGQVTGLLVQLPGWQYPAVINTATGEISYDSFGGTWGEERFLQQFLQMYAVEVAKLEARKKGYLVSEHALQDGSIRVQIVEGSA